MKFFSLFKKEVREMLTFQTILSLVFGVLLFIVLGSVMKGVQEDASNQMLEGMGKLAISDQDQSALSQQVLQQMRDQGYQIELLEGSDDEILRAAQEKGYQSALVIPEGFEQGIEKGGEPQKIRLLNEIKGGGMTSLMSGAEGSVEAINDTLSAILIEEGGYEDAAFVRNPVVADEFTYVGDKSVNVSASVLSGLIMMQGIFIPIIVFILVMFASQMTVSAIANEKADKTLETLLCAPVSRFSVLGAKMLAAALVALLQAVVFMFGFRFYMGGMTAGAMEGASGIGTALNTLGLTLGPADYLLVGLQMFLTIMIALCLSTMLGAMANDVKSAQTAVMPIMLLIMVPYFFTLFLDVNTLSGVGKYLLYAIPFTHTFTAANNVMFGNYTVFLGGLAYQAVFFAVLMFLTVKLFNSDKLFTMQLNFGKKKKVAAE